MTSNKKRFAILIAILLLVLVGLAIYFQGRYNDIDVNNVNPTPRTNNNPTIEILSRPTSPRVSVGNTDTIRVELAGESARIPTAIDLTFSFDPSLVEVVNIVPGRIWNSSNVLKKTIDNDRGTVRLAAGQGFNAQTTEHLDIVEIEYRVIAPGEIVFELTDASKFAFVGESDVFPVSTNQIVISAD